MKITLQKLEELLHKLKHCIINITIFILTILDCISILSQAFTENLIHVFNLGKMLFEEFGSVTYTHPNITFWNIIFVGIIVLAIVFHEFKHPSKK